MLEIRNLHKRYDDVVALDGCSFDVPPGRMLGFLGPNGAGKTTTMRSIFGLLRLDEGEVLWNGQAIDADDRLRFGYMPEQRGLYPKMRVRDQLIYLGRLHGMAQADAAESADRWLEEFDLADRASSLVEELSHGNQQRVQLAAALVHDPELLVLDEPFNGLDPIGAETMANVLRGRVAEGASVVFSSHQLDLVEDLCEDVAIIANGRIVMEGSVRDLKDASPHRVIELELGSDRHELLERLDGVVTASFDGRRHLVVVDKDIEVRPLIAEATNGAIDHFVYTTPALSHLFKEAVA
ncbi:MAG: ABC transporter ATP-binding protein [Acidimicrobiia bacterium]|nr:ABC transporter ATP-binding protein [Acidimicrobiia bacterium]